MLESDLIVRRIKEGTVIDHVAKGRGLQVVSALEITGSNGHLITIALNVPSSKHSKKDIIKIEDQFLKADETNKLAVIAPTCTINIIRDYKLVEKHRVEIPDMIENIFACSNPDCVTNGTEQIKPVMDVVEKSKRILKCRYCSRILDMDNMKYI